MNREGQRECDVINVPESSAFNAFDILKPPRAGRSFLSQLEACNYVSVFNGLTFPFVTINFN